MSKLISGIWYFNETLTFDNAVADYPINFTSSYHPNEKYTVMDAYSEDEHGRVEYETATGDEYPVYGISPQWDNEEARTVDFGSTPQSVSDEFYTWLTANATKSGLSNLKTVTESIKKYVDSKDADIKESVNSKAAAGAKLMDTSIAQIKDVPSDTAKYAEVKKIGGMTRKCGNLLPYPYTAGDVGTVIESSGGKIEVLQGGGLSLSGTPTGYIGLRLYSGAFLFKGEQTISLQGTFANYYATVFLYDSPSAATHLAQITVNKPTTFNTNDYPTATYMIIDTSRNSSNVAMSGIVYPMLNEGSTALPYEPYFEGLRDAKVTEMKSVGANLIPYPYADTTKTVNGITFTDNGDGTVTANGTATAKADFMLSNSLAVKAKTIISGAPNGTSATTFEIQAYLDADNYIQTINNREVATKDFNAPLRIRIRSGYTANNLVFKPMLNKGAEALPYTPYMESTLPIPEAVQALDGYGWGINADCYNYIDWEKKQFGKRVGKVDLGTLDWYYSAWGTGNVFSVYNLNLKQHTKAVLCTERFISDNEVYAATADNVFCVNGGAIRGRFTDYTDAATFKSAMQGVMLYYELAEPVITDISDLLPEDNFIEVEGDGSITAVNEYGYDVPSEIVFNTKNNEQVNANTFVGDLIGKAQSAERDGAGRLLEDTYMSYSYDKVYTGETAAVSEFYAGETTYVSGVWVFNETVSGVDEQTEQSVNFVCDGVNCNIIIITTDGSLDFTPLSEQILNYVNPHNSWLNEAYRTVDFGEKDQLTSPEFYTWLCANAIKQ